MLHFLSLFYIVCLQAQIAYTIHMSYIDDLASDSLAVCNCYNTNRKRVNEQVMIQDAMVKDW